MFVFPTSIASSMAPTGQVIIPDAMVSERKRRRRTLIGTLAVLAGLSVVLFGAFWLIDFFCLHEVADDDPGPWARLIDFDPDTLQNALGSLAQIIAAVLGIAITVVSI